MTAIVASPVRAAVGASDRHADVDVDVVDTGDTISATAHAGGDVVATGWIERRTSGRPSRMYVDVSPSERGHGVGSAVVDKLVYHARAAGITMLAFDADASDAAVRALTHRPDAICARRVSDGRMTGVLLLT